MEVRSGFTATTKLYRLTKCALLIVYIVPSEAMAGATFTPGRRHKIIYVMFLAGDWVLKYKCCVLGLCWTTPYLAKRSEGL